MRHYTPVFARKIASLLDKLMPPCDPISHDDSIDAIALWESWSFDDLWDDASMRSFIVYLYGARSLKVPAKWKAVFPREI